MKKSLLVLILAVTSLLTGCAGALLGNGGNQPNNNETREQRSIEQITADGMITSSIRSRYANDVVLKKLNVSTYRGVVTLYGIVPTRNVMERAITLARSVKGVKQVKSGIRLH